MKKPSKPKPKTTLKSKSTSQSKTKSKGLVGYEQISQDEELRKFLPPGSQIQPGSFGGTTIVIPFPGGFNPTMPTFRGPWAKIREEIFLFEVFVSDDGKNRPAQADRPPKGVDALCDEWIAAFYKDKNRWDQPAPPKKIAPWLIARAHTAGMYASMENSHGLKPPTGKFENIMCGLLINLWNTGANTTWVGFHPDASSHSE